MRNLKFRKIGLLLLWVFFSASVLKGQISFDSLSIKRNEIKFHNIPINQNDTESRKDKFWINFELKSEFPKKIRIVGDVVQPNPLESFVSDSSSLGLDKIYIHSMGNYHNGKKVGIWIYFGRNGRLSKMISYDAESNINGFIQRDELEMAEYAFIRMETYSGFFYLDIVKNTISESWPYFGDSEK